MSEFDDFLADFYTQFDTSRAFGASCKQDLTNAQISYAGGDDHAALGSLINSVDKLVDTWLYFYDTYVYPYPRYNLIKLFDITGSRLDALEAGGVTMDAINSAMLTATDDQYKYFIGLVDAFRVGLWNKPFEAEFFAALARGFAGVRV